MYINIFLINITIFLTCLFAQQKLIGIGYSTDPTIENAVNAAKKMALGDLINQIRVDVKSDYEQQVEEKNSYIKEDTKYWIKTASSLPLLGVVWEEVSKKEPTCFKAILYPDSSRKTYLYSINDNIEKINTLVSKTDWTKDIELLNELFNLYNQIDQERIVYALLGGDKNKLKKIKIVKKDIEIAIKKKYSVKPKSITDAAKIVAQRLFYNVNDPCSFKINELTLGKYNFCSNFSEYFMEKLEIAISDIIHKRNLFKVTKSNNYEISGTYWNFKDSIDIFLSMNSSLNHRLNSASISIPKKWIMDKGLEIEPPNINEVKNNEYLFSTQEVEYGKIKMQFWTNKGRDAVVYHDGEEVNLYVLVNSPVYLRCIYYLSNGDKIALFENYFINKSMINHTIKLPTLVCAPPFGVEKFQMFASTKRFPPLTKKKKKIDGVEYDLIDSSVRDLIITTRGMLPKEKDNHAERIITVTTMQ